MNDKPKLDAVDRRVRVLIIASAFLLIFEGALILVAASPKLPEERAAGLLGRADYSRTPIQGQDASRGSSDSDQSLGLDALKRLSPEEAAFVAFRWARESSKTGPLTDQDVEAILPSPAFFLARTAAQSDVDDIKASADGDNAFSRAYKPMAQAIPGSNAAGARVEAVLDVIYGFRTSLAQENTEGGQKQTLYPPVPREERWIAPAEELKKTHQNALDIFFYHQSGWVFGEKGPVIRSMSPGIVVAAANDWNGGDNEEKYRRGGLTPRAGNGAIVYDPGTRRYYTYFHLHDVSVKPGQIVSPGTPLGHGGNTGTNARKRGHGGHLHLEIYNADTNEALDCYGLRDLILFL